MEMMMTSEITTPNFWDCDCDEDYIHPKALTHYCEKCGAHDDEDHADSMRVEVALWLEKNPAWSDYFYC
jgi:hypothetical protein